MSHSKPPTEHQRQQLEQRACALRCYYGSNADMSAAVDMFEQEWNNRFDEADPQRISAVRKFIKYQVEKFNTFYTLWDVFKPSRKHKLPDDVAVECAKIIAEGYWEPRVAGDGAGGQVYWEQRHYCSIHEAVTNSAQLAQVLTQHNITIEYLRDRVKEVDPDLYYGPLPMKLRLTPATQAALVAYCRDMLYWLEVHPDYLEYIYWMDEVRIYINRDTCKRLRVWYHKSDVWGQSPEPNECFKIKGAKRIDVLLVVNARHGLVWVEFLTGTTDIKEAGRHNAMMQAKWQQRGGTPYMVSGTNRK